MHTKNPLLDEFSKLTAGAMGLAQAASEEAKTAFRAQADRFVAELDLVRRDDLEALKVQIEALRREVRTLKGEVEDEVITAEPVEPAAAPEKTEA